MIVPLEQLPPTERAPRPRAASPLSRVDRYAALRAPLGLCVAALGFFCFMPYPALRVGNASALQAGNVLVLLLSIPALFLSWRKQPFWVYPLLAAPLCFSVLKAAVAGQSALDVCLKTLVVWNVSILAVLATQLVAPRYALQVLTGIAAAMLVHAAVGVLQVYWFSHDEFPMAFLYVNNSFLSVQDNAGIIARYVQRPFGLFPEPSAMSSSIGPWVVFLLGVSCGAVRLKAQTNAQVRRWHRWLFLAAAVGGLGLIIVSRSGHAAVVALAVGGLVAAWFMRARATPKTIAGVLAGLGLFLPVVLYFAAMSVGERLGGKTAFGNSSWGERADSLAAGFNLLASSDFWTQLFGTGVGQASLALQSSAGLDAVFSVLLTYVFETGVVGALALVWVFHRLLRTWSSLRFDGTFALVGVVWVVGVTLITSYEQLLPLWMTLGWLTVWPAVCQPAPAPLRAARGAVSPSTRHHLNRRRRRAAARSAQEVAIEGGLA
jgi:hypothetical protein